MLSSARAAGTTSTVARDQAGIWRDISSRSGVKRASPALLMPPPMTIRAGFKNMMQFFRPRASVLLHEFGIAELDAGGLAVIALEPDTGAEAFEAAACAAQALGTVGHDGVMTDFAGERIVAVIEAGIGEQ